MEKFDLENFPVSESAKNMIASVSDGFYDNSYVGKWLYEVMGQEYDTAREIAEDILNQLFPETATWGLMYHERYCAEHPEYKNSKAVNAIAEIDKVYQKCMEKNSFL